MNCSRYLIVCKEQPLAVGGANGGAEMATRRLAQYLVRAGMRVVVAANLGGADTKYEGVEYWDYGAAYDVAKIFDRAQKYFGNFHLLAVNRAHPLIESRGRPAILSRVFISHDRHGSDAGISLQIVSHIADRILAVSEAHRQELIRAGADERITEVIHNGVDFDTFRVGNVGARDACKLVFAGALVQDKGLHLLLQAYAQLKPKYPQLSLDVYGSAALWGRDPIFDQQSLEGQLPGLKFHGAVNAEQLSQAYRAAGICVFPSIWFECFPLVSLEAQASGCPVVAFDVGGVKEGLIPDGTGILIQDISVDSLARALDELLSNPGQQRILGEAAAAHVRKNFTWEKVAAKVCAAAENARRKTAQTLVATPVGVISTWNQQCGLATYAQYLFSQLPPGTVHVFAEDAADAQREKDQPWVTRCWQRRGDDLQLLERTVVDSGIRLLHLNFHDHSFIDHTFLIPFLKRIKQRGITVVTHLHTTYADDPKLRQYIAHVDHLIVHGPESRLQLVAVGARPENVHALPHGVYPVPRAKGAERERYRAAFMPDAAAKLIISFGFIQPNKGVEAVIEAVAHLTSRGIAAHGFLAGKLNDAHPQSKLYFDELQQYAQRLGVAARITFANRFLSEQEVAECLSVADLVVMNYSSQYYEASGACARAVGAGALVAASLSPNFTCFGDAVWHLTSGFPVGQSAELLFTNQGLADALRANADAYVERNRWDVIAGRLADLYREWGFELSPSERSAALSAAAPETLTEEQIDQLAASGEAALRSGDNLKARDTLLSLIARAPNAERALRALGTLALTEKNVADAKAFFTKAIALQPTNAKTLGGLGMCAMSEGDMPKAHDYLLESLAHDPHFLLGLRNLIQTSFTLEKYEDLERSIREYLVLHPENEEIHYCLAGCLHKKGDNVGALRVLDAILERNPQHALALELLERIQGERATRDPQISRESAQVDLRLSELEEAKRQKLLDAVYRGIEELEHKSLTTAQMERLFILRGETLAMDGQLQKAEQCFKQVLEVDPDNGRAMSGMGAICTAKEDLKTAEQWFKRALLRHERIDIALTGLGICAQWKGDTSLAWDYYRKALTVNAENEQALYGVVQIGMLRRSFAEVEDSLRNYLEFRPANLDHIYSLAGCLYAQQKHIEALDELDKVLLFEPRHANALELKNIIVSRALNEVESLIK